jgi:hypothetical protein
MAGSAAALSRVGGRRLVQTLSMLSAGLFRFLAGVTFARGIHDLL